MKYYDSLGPNPRFVRIVMAEKSIEIPTEQVDIMGGENRQDDHLARNPMGQLPCLELDNGTFLSEITAIGELLEELHPTPALVGTTPEERAEARMWTRRIDLNVVEPLVGGFRNAEGLAMFKDRIRTMPEAADSLKAVAQDNLAKVDATLAEYAQAVLRALLEVETALAVEASMAERDRQLARATQRADQARGLAEERYRAGRTDILSVLTAQRQAYESESAWVNARRLHLEQRVDLMLALGGGLHDGDVEPDTATNTSR